MNINNSNIHNDLHLHLLFGVRPVNLHVIVIAARILTEGRQTIPACKYTSYGIVVFL